MRRLLAIVLLPAFFLTACGSNDSSTKSSDAGSGITVTGAVNKTPASIKGVKGYTTTKTTDKVVKEGSGESLKDGDNVSINYVLYGAKDGKSVVSTYQQGAPVSLTLNAAQDKLLSGAIVGHKLGSRLLITAPASAFYGDSASSSGVDPKEALVLVADLTSKFKAPTANGAIGDVSVTGKPGTLPVVKAKPNLYVAKTESKALVPGKGPVVKSGESVTVRYLGVDARNGKTFDSSFSRKPDTTSFKLTTGTGGVIPGFVKGLVGQKIGSRVLVTIPYTDGYGVQGNSQAGINGGDTLIFVIDLVKKG